MASLRLADGTETVLGLPRDEDFQRDLDHLGAVAGRFANRLRPFEIDGQTFTPAPNEGPNCLHGGPGGFGLRDWEVVFASTAEAVLRLVSEDGDQGFPGILTTRLHVSLHAREVRFQFEAETTEATPVNLTLHPYFRLAGSDIRDHHLRLRASGVLAVDEQQLPTGEVLCLGGDALDLEHGGALGPRIDATGGLDHCYLTPGGSETLLRHPGSGRTLLVRSDAPAVQIYTGSGLRPPHRGFAGVAIEPQSVPNAPNLPSFEDTVLRPGQIYRRFMSYEFGGG